MSKRILDFNSQLFRIFGHHVFDYDQVESHYNNSSQANGIYDIIFCHREGIQDNFEEIKSYTKPTTHLIIDTTVESGNIDSLLDAVNHICETEPFKVTLIIDADMNCYLENNKVSFECIYGFELVFFAHTNAFSDSRILIDHGANNYTYKFQSLNGSVRENRVLLLLELIKRRIGIGEGDNPISFLFYTNQKEKFSQKNFDTFIKEMEFNGKINKEDVQLLLNFDLPLHYDYMEEDYHQMDIKIDSKYASVINIVTENTHGLGKTNDISKYITTFTEKTIFPFLSGQIPIFIGPPNLEKELRKLGFDLFDDLIDYSFESEQDPHTRLKLKIDELERILDTDIFEYRKLNNLRFHKNRILVQKLVNKGFDIIDEFITNIIYT